MSELVIQYGITALVAILGFLSMLLTRYVWELIKRNWLREMLQRLWEEVKTAVLAVGQTYVDGLKEGNEDGKLTPEEKSIALSRAVEEIKSNFGMKGLRSLARVLGIDSIDDWLGAKVEAVIGEEKRLGKLLPPALAK